MTEVRKGLSAEDGSSNGSGRKIAQRVADVLETYRIRGEKALDCLACGDWEGFEATMRLRRAAWSNLQVMFAQLPEESMRDLELSESWRRASSVNDLLSGAVLRERESLEREMIGLGRVRKELSRFKSGEPEVAGAVERGV